MKAKNIRKLTIAGVLVAVAVVGSLFSIPVLGAKCSPVQHMVNVLGAVLLGPGYAVGMAFAAALIRNLLGLGSLLAFPGSMIGALLCGVAYKLCPKLPAAYAGEVFGTGILGGLSSYPIGRCPHGQHQGSAVHLCTELPYLDCGRRGDFCSRAVRAQAHACVQQP